MNSIWANPSTIAAFLSAVAAIAAAVATWRSPISAARIADDLRRRGENEMESRRFRMNIFAYVMQGRAEIYSEETVRALNSIDFAFANSELVREAWAELFQALNTAPMLGHVVDERIRKLLRVMAQDLGLADKLRLDDFGRVYFPNALQQDREVRGLQQAETLRKLKGQDAAAQSSANPAEPQISLWPPKPDDTAI